MIDPQLYKTLVAIQRKQAWEVSRFQLSRAIALGFAYPVDGTYKLTSSGEKAVQRPSLERWS